MHGDHCFGIPGVLRAIDAARLERGAGGANEPVHIYGPPGAPAPPAGVAASAGLPCTPVQDEWRLRLWGDLRSARYMLSA